MLAVCLCLLAISVTYRWLNPYRQERVAALTFQQAHKADPAPPEQVSGGFDRDVRVDLFLDPPVHSGVVQKNIFQRLKGPASPPAGPEEQAEIRPESVRTPEKDPRLQVQEELSRFRAFGYLQGKNEKVLFLERGKDILLIREGDRIDGKYLIKSITEKHLVIRAETIGEDVRIELTKF